MLMKIFWVGLFGLSWYLLHKLYRWVGDEAGPPKEELRSLTVSCSNVNIGRYDLIEVLKKINQKIEVPIGTTARPVGGPINIKDVVSISTINTDKTIQFVIWYKNKPIKKKKPRTYNPYVLGGGEHQHQQKSYWS